MKAVLVIDMPEHMRIEDTKCLHMTLYNGLYVHELSCDCPLKPLPKYEKANKGSYGEFKAIDEAWTQGYNACLREIQK